MTSRIHTANHRGIVVTIFLVEKIQLSSANVHQGYAVVPYWHYIGVKGTIPKSASAEPPVPHRDARSGRCEIRFLGLRWVPHCDNTPVPLNCLYHMYED